MLTEEVLMGHDTQSWMTASHEASSWKEVTGHTPLWTESMFSGMPTFQIIFEAPYNFVAYLSKILTAVPRPAYFIFMYLLGGYVMLLCFGLNPWISAMGAIPLALGSYNFIIITAGHSTKASVIAIAMMIIGGIVLILRDKKKLGICLLSIFIGLGIYFNHIQILYYTLFIILIMMISEGIFAIKNKETKAFFNKCLCMLIPLILGIGMNATLLLTTYDYAKHTMRGDSTGLTLEGTNSEKGLSKDYITEWSYGIDETMTLLIPNYKGGASAGKLSADSKTAEHFKTAYNLRKIDRTLSDSEKKRIESSLKNNTFNPRSLEELMYAYDLPLYWGPQRFTSGPVYLGAIVIFLFVLGLIILPNKYKWWLLGATLLSILLSWGKNFMPLTNFFIEYVPLYNKFRAVSMTLVIAGITMPLMAILTINEILKNHQPQKNKKALLISSGITALVCSIFWLIPSIAGDFVSINDANFQGQMAFLAESLPADRKDLLSSDALRSLIFILLSAASLFLFISNKIKKEWLIAILTLLFVIDLGQIDKRYFNDSNFTKKTSTKINATLCDREILRDTDLSYRMVDLTSDAFNSSSASYFHKNIGGYHAAKLRRYQDIINVHLDKELKLIYSGLQTAQSQEDVDNIFSQTPVINALNTKYIKYHPDAEPLINIHAMGNAWFVDQIKFVENANEEILALNNTDLATTLICNKKYQNDLTIATNRDTLATIELIEYAPDKLTYHISSKTNQVAVFSEVYYENGWNIFINGEKYQTPICCDYILRGLSIPAGDYDLTMEFCPTSYRVGNIISIISSLLFLILIGFLIYKERKENYGK
ncbi:MAG: hypothetical protein IJ270_04210 [Paludibacteraceae bacterium]|nr:hypothetical protein [Paludibacteraceae bacterium]